MDKKQIAVNNWFVYLIFIGISALVIAAFFYCVDEKGLCLLGVLGAVVSLVCAFLEPCFYFFDEESIAIQFVFNKKDRYLWKNIKKISEGYDNIFHRWHLVVPSKTIYKIDGKSETDEKWYMHGYIRKSRRVKRLLKEYWGDIETL